MSFIHVKFNFVVVLLKLVSAEMNYKRHSFVTKCGSHDRLLEVVIGVEMSAYQLLFAILSVVPGRKGPRQ